MRTTDLGNILLAMSGYMRQRASQHHERHEETEANIMYSMAFAFETGAQAALNIAVREANREVTPIVVVRPNKGQS